MAVDSAGTLDLNGWSPTYVGLIDGPDGGGTVTNSATTGAVLTLAPLGTATPSFSGTIEDGAGGARSP